MATRSATIRFDSLSRGHPLKLSPAIAVSICLLHAAIAFGQTADTRMAQVAVVGAVSTMGYKMEVATPIAARTNIRGGFNILHLAHDFERHGIALDARLRMQSVDAYLDWFPFGGQFHLSPGLVLYNGNKATADATVSPNKKFTLGGSDLISNSANPVTGNARVSFEKVAPGLVIGWGNVLAESKRRWSIPVDLGFFYVRSPKATLNLAGSACSVTGANCWNIATDPGLQQLVVVEQNQISDDLSWLKVYPVASVGFSYRF